MVDVVDSAGAGAGADTPDDGEAATGGAELGHHRRLARGPARRLGDLRPRRQSGVRLLSERDRGGRLAAGAHRQAVDGAARQPAAVLAGLRARHRHRRPGRADHRALPHGRGGDRHLHHRRLRHAAGGAGAAAGAVAGARLRGQGRGGVPDVGVPDLHQHLARRHRGAQDPDRGRQVVRGAQCRDPAPDHPAGDAALHHGRHPPRRGARRGRHGDRGVLHLDLGPGRDHHHLGQQFRHRHHVCSDFLYR